MTMRRTRVEACSVVVVVEQEVDRVDHPVMVVGV